MLLSFLILAVLSPLDHLCVKRIQDINLYYTSSSNCEKSLTEHNRIDEVYLIMEKDRLIFNPTKDKRVIQNLDILLYKLYKAQKWDDLGQLASMYARYSEDNINIALFYGLYLRSVRQYQKALKYINMYYTMQEKAKRKYPLLDKLSLKNYLELIDITDSYPNLLPGMSLQLSNYPDLRDYYHFIKREYQYVQQCAKEHYIFEYYYPLDSDKKVVEEVKRQSIHAYNFIKKNFNVSLSIENDVVMYNRRSRKHVNEFFPGIYDGKIRVYLGIPDAMGHIIVHELTHAAIDELSRGQAPRWVHEGLAQVMEEEYTRESPQPLSSGLIQWMNLTSIKSIEFNNFYDIYRFYSNSYYYIKYLYKKNGMREMVAFLRALANNSQEKAMASVFRITDEDLEREMRLTWNYVFEE